MRPFRPLYPAACALAMLAAWPGPLVARPAPHLAPHLAPHPPEAPAAPHMVSDIALSAGRSRLITLPAAMKDVFVADDKVADVQVKSARQLYVFAKANGQTSIYASNAAGQVIWQASLRVGANIDSVEQMLALAMPEAHIQVATMGTSTVLLTGSVANPEDSAEAQRLVQAFIGKEANVITRLKLATPLQVNLQVRIAEVSRSLTRQLGSNIATQSARSGGFTWGLSQGRGAGTVTSTLPKGVETGVSTAGMPVIDASSAFGLPTGSLTLPFDAATGKFVAPGVAGAAYAMAGNLSNASAIGLAGRLLGVNVLATLDAGEQVGLVSTLAQPNLTAISGETADFLAGGEFPIPLSSGLGSTSIEYKKFGVSLSYTPTVLADGRISLRVRPEVSELSSNGSVQMNGFSIPSLTVRRAETTVELGSGQSFMIAGLLSNNANHTIQKIPGAGDVPILGALFKSTSFQQGETELVIVITPYLVRPVNDGDIKLPTDGYQSPDAVSQLLGDVLSKSAHPARADKPHAAAPHPAPPPVAAPPAGEPPAPGFSQN